MQRSLAQIQAWMQAVITDPGGVVAGSAGIAAREALGQACAIGEVILPSQALSSGERLAVYGNAYYARLLHCLQDLFPAVREAVGEEAFDDFAFAYLQRYPSQSYTLGRLADRFVQFLAESRVEFFSEAAEQRPDDPAADQETTETIPAWADFMVELARLEYTIDEVFDGPGLEREPLELAQDLASLAPEALDRAHLELACCVRLLACEFPVNTYYTAFRRGESPDIPDREPCWLAVTRRDYLVRRYPLSFEQFTLLSALGQGVPLGAALAQTAAVAAAPEELAAALHDWFARWTRDRIFTRLTLAATE